MNPEEYAAARRGRLVERAIELGAPEATASEYVDRVLLEQRREIKRADEPDPLVREALRRAIHGEPARRGRTGAIVAVGAVAVAVAVGVVLTYEPSTTPMPSMFGYDGESAAAVLEAQGYDVVLREAQSCEPRGLVLRTQPRSGEPVKDGAQVTVATAVLVPGGSGCGADVVDRYDAWKFIRFTLDDTAPEFTETVNLIVDGSPTTRLSGVTPWDDAGWAGPRRLVAQAARATVESATGMARLTVTTQVPPASTCGVDRPATAGEREVLRLEIDTRPSGDNRGCPLTVDLYRSSRVIDSVVIYRARDDD